MTPHTLANDAATKLAELQTMTELRNEQGAVIGYFVPPNQAERLLRLWGEAYLEGVEPHRARLGMSSGRTSPPNVWDYSLEELLDRVAFVEEVERKALAEALAEDPDELDRLEAEQRDLPQLTTREVLERIHATENDECRTS